MVVAGSSCSAPVSSTPPDRTTARKVRANPDLNATQQALEVLFAAVLIHAVQAALEDAEEPFNAVRGYVATGVFLGAVVHRLMLGELGTHGRIKAALVGVG